MEHTLNRIPPDISSKMMLHVSKEEILKKYLGVNLKSKSKLNLEDNIEEVRVQNFTLTIVFPIKFIQLDVAIVQVQEKVEKIVEEFHAPLVEKGIQTNKTNYVEPERLHKHLEESSVRINEACKQMENICSRLKSEKEELEVLLKEERKTVACLRNKVNESEKEKVKSTNFNSTCNKLTTFRVTVSTLL